MVITFDVAAEKIQWANIMIRFVDSHKMDIVYDDIIIIIMFKRNKFYI